MSKSLSNMVQAQRRSKAEAMPRDERRALHKTRQEAAQHGATLQHDGKGGLSSSLALGVYRRDGWRCKRCGGKEQLGLHHKGDAKQAIKWLAKGKSNDLNNIVVVCGACHNAVHDESRELE